MSKKLSFPFRIDPRTGGVAYETNPVKQLADEVQQLACTGQRERVMLPAFGTTLREKIFEPVNINFQYLVKNEIQEAVSYWLVPIKISDVQVTYEDTSIQIFLIMETGDSEFQLMLPLKEGI